MKTQILIIISISLMTGCQSPGKTVEKRDNELIFDEGIYVEKFDSTNISENRYTANNITYLEGNKLTYDYFYEDLNGKKYKFQEPEGISEFDFRERVKAWAFVNIDSLTERTIDKVELTVKYGLETMAANNPDYNQTVISYEYVQVNGKRNFSSLTGVIDNEKNVWIHPPRSKLFRILEINPLPFIQTPYKIGNMWNWSLEIGSAWGDERWKTWEGSIKNKYEYEITDKKKINIEIGEIECYVVQSTARSSIGQTHLTAYFNKEIGFVKLDYTNIDSTRIALELIHFEKKKHD
ncbi:MAG: hypothetical protein KDE26_14405 [Bacteroidetes bacterium]|nr:hypothetical protein [Bacteroidota bacterium]MCB0844442.1 hypothetical protein [Bacteroidota bacterium]